MVNGYQTTLTKTFVPEADARHTVASSRVLLSADPYHCKSGLVQCARYAIAAIESGLPSTMNASSSFTRYRNGLSPVVSPDVSLPLTWQQMMSKGWPNVFFLVARFMSTNSADAGSSIFAATVIFAFFQDWIRRLRGLTRRGALRSRSSRGRCFFHGGRIRGG